MFTLLQLDKTNKPKVASPYKVLEDYAKLFEVESDGLLEGWQHTSVGRNTGKDTGKDTGDDTIVYHTLHVSIPSLQGYSFQLLEVSQLGPRFYPVRVTLFTGHSSISPPEEYSSESDLRKGIEKLLSREEAQQILSDLAEQARIAQDKAA